MHSFEEIKAILGEKSGKKLVTFSVAFFLVLTLIVFYVVSSVFGHTRIRQMEEYLGEIPQITEGIQQELLMRSDIYAQDALVRAELGLKLYQEDDGLTDAEKLERVRGAVSAESVSLLDGKKEILSTTGIVTPEEHFRSFVQTLEPRVSDVLTYPALTKEGEDTGKEDGEGFVLMPLPGSAGRSLVFEFSCDALMKLRASMGKWSDVLERMVSGGDAIAFARFGDSLACFPADAWNEEETARLKEELTEIFRNSGSYGKTEEGTAYRIVNLAGRRYLAVMTHFSQEAFEDADVLLAIPLGAAIGNGIYIAITVSALIGWGIVLLQIYMFRSIRRKRAGKGMSGVTGKWVFRATWPGIIVLLAATIVFSTMLILLESRSNVAYIAETKRVSVQYVINLRQYQERTIRGTFANLYRERAEMLADYLKDHPEERTAEGLKELSRMAGTEYLMLFDSEGKEIESSNSYTGFSVGENLSEEYRSVLLGYPSAMAGPEADPYTGKMQLGAAILMTDSTGKPDGFLLAVYSAGDLNAELKRMSYESTVNSFTVQKGHIAAAVSTETGLFIAHTDPEMIGLEAKSFIYDFEPGKNYEGFMTYKGEDVCISAETDGKKTLLYIVPRGNERYVQSMSALTYTAILAVLLIVFLLYYPVSGRLMARAMIESEGKLPPSAGDERPMLAFSDGYSFFLTLFVLFALIASSSGWWTSFDYLFSRQWSNGVHLYSIWAALFAVSGTLFAVSLFRIGLSRLERSLSFRAKTVARLANSLVHYSAFLYLAFSILSMFGVNTTALLASAGVISIAAGMGAQSMASDLIAGLFLMLEGAVHVGDEVNITNIKGTVTDMGIRTTQITDKDGNVYILNNSKVNPVCNMSRKTGLKDPDAGQKAGSGEEPKTEPAEKAGKEPKKES